MKFLRIASIGLVLFVVLNVMPVLAVMGDTPPGGGVGTIGVEQINGTALEYTLLKDKVTLWADGRGDVIIDSTLRNVDIEYWTDFTWYFNWPSADYSNIKAWDNWGPLQVVTERSGTYIYVTTRFRHPVNPGSTYQYGFQITIGDMAQGSGDNWEASWYIKPGNSTRNFIQGVTFPANAILGNINPAPTSRSGNYVEWAQSNLPAGWNLTISVPYTLSNTVPVPYLSQNWSPWGTQPYAFNPDNGIDTIDRWGCFLTSAVMLVNYWAEVQHISFRTYPDLMDTWLKNQPIGQGYDASNGVVHDAVANYARANGVTLYRTETIGRNDAVLDDYLRTGNPVILQVCLPGSLCPSHFVVATGKIVVNGSPTYSLNDPEFGYVTLEQKYNGVYYKMVTYSQTSEDKRSLRISAHSPIQFVVTDPLGRRSGYDPATGQVLDEIPLGEYFEDAIVGNGDPDSGVYLSSLVFEVNDPVDGIYAYTIYGTGTGSYEINATTYNWHGDAVVRYEEGQIAVGEALDYEVPYEATPLFYTYLPMIQR